MGAGAQESHRVGPFLPTPTHGRPPASLLATCHQGCSPSNAWVVVDLVFRMPQHFTLVKQRSGRACFRMRTVILIPITWLLLLAPLFSLPAGPDEDLVQAAQDGDLNRVKQALVGGGHLEARGQDGATPLHMAAWKGHVPVVEFLLKSGANIHALNSKGRTALHWAAPNGRLEVVQVLLKAGVRIDHQDQFGITALSFAAQQGQTAVVALLLKSGAKVNLKNTEGRSALAVAAARRQTDSMRLLIEAKADVNSLSTTGTTPLFDSVFARDEVGVGLLIRAGAKVGIQEKQRGLTALHLAAHVGHPGIVQLLLSARADVNLKDGTGRTPLAYAKARKHTEVVRLLTGAGARE